MMKKNKLLEELNGAVMQALREALHEHRRVLQDFNESSDEEVSFSGSDVLDEGMLLDLAEDRIQDAVEDTMTSMIDDGDITVKEDATTDDS